MRIESQQFDAERALYGIQDAEIIDCQFDGPADGESALKETGGLTVTGCRFNLRYPLWHTQNTTVTGSEMTALCRAPLWYGKELNVSDCTIDGIKALRECRGLSVSGCEIHSPEFAWKCRKLKLRDCRLTSDYAFFECNGLQVDALTMDAKYAFQYIADATIHDCTLNTKDAFWHCRNVTVSDCVIRSEYLGWYSENLTLVRCRIIGTQPLCYCRGLVLEDCTMEQADLAFENSVVNATVRGRIDSVKNPKAGSIDADEIGAVILDPARIDPTRTTISCRKAPQTVG